MRVSIAFLIHLIGFGILAGTLVAGYLLDSRFRKEQDLGLKVYTASLARRIGLLSPLAAGLLLLSGIGNIINDYGTSDLHWYDQGWLVAKLVLFTIMVLNGSIYGPRLTRGRLKLTQAQLDQPAEPNTAGRIQSYNRQIVLFYIVQSIILLLILFLSLFGTAKHPGAL